MTLLLQLVTYDLIRGIVELLLLVLQISHSEISRVRALSRHLREHGLSCALALNLRGGAPPSLHWPPHIACTWVASYTRSQKMTGCTQENAVCAYPTSTAMDDCFGISEVLQGLLS